MTTNRFLRYSLGLLVLLVFCRPTVQADPPVVDPAKTDAHGDPLPAHALARLGSTAPATCRAHRVCGLCREGQGTRHGCDGRHHLRARGCDGKELRRCGTRDAPSRRDDIFGPGPDQLADLLHPVALSADGTVAAVGTSKGDVRLWDVATAKELRVIKPGHVRGLANLALSATANYW